MRLKVLIEASAGSCRKELFDETSFAPRGRRETLIPYPHSYGFIPGSRGFDGEALDCFIVDGEAYPSGSLVEAELRGLLEFFEEGEPDHKLIAAPPGSDIMLGERLKDELATFMYGIFRAYPDMEVRVGDLLQRDETRALLGSRLSFADE